MNRYAISGSESEDIQNLLGLKNKKDIDEKELEGFFFAEQKALDDLSDQTFFDLEYLYQLHKNMFGELYDFAGRVRQVNMTKEGFAFAPVQFLLESLQYFQEDFLENIDDFIEDEKCLLSRLAEIHAELLFLHPFREGNGRSIRLFTDLIYFYYTKKRLNFDALDNEKTLYIQGVQQASWGEYSIMQDLFIRANI